MPNTTLQDALKEAYAVAPAQQIILHTLEIRQTGVQSPIYIVRDRKELVATTEESEDVTFQPCGFQFSLPPENEEGFRSLNIAMDNVKRIVTPFITAAKSQRVPVEAIYRPYLSTDLTRPQMDPPLLLYLKDLSVTGPQVTGRATFQDLVNKRFPLELYTRYRFPTLG